MDSASKCDVVEGHVRKHAESKKRMKSVVRVGVGHVLTRALRNYESQMTPSIAGYVASDTNLLMCPTIDRVACTQLKRDVLDGALGTGEPNVPVRRSPKRYSRLCIFAPCAFSRF